jgi:LysR family transcriptional regulator, hydrogen peroxide-inducible genes activator
MRLGPHPVSLRQLQYVAAIAETLSFRRAAEACGVSQPSLSAQVAELESALGQRLFERDRRRVLVTPSGEELVGRARRLLLEADALVDAAQRLKDPLAGTLRIGVIPTISPYLLPEATPLIRRQYPRLHVAWVEEKTAELMARLGAGDLEGALVASDSDGADLEREIVAKDAFLLAVGSSHRLARSTSPVTFAALRDNEVLLLDEGHCLRDQALPLCSRAGTRESGFRATSLSTLAQMVAGGSGVTLLPRLAVAAESRRGQIAVRRFGEPAPYRTLALVWRKRSAFRAALKPLAAVLRAAYARGVGRPASRPGRSAARERGGL